MRKLQIVAASALLLGSFSLGCGGKPTQDECQKFADHFVKLMLEGMSDESGESANPLGEEVKNELVDSCVKEGTKKEVDCVLAASTMEEVEKNCQM